MEFPILDVEFTKDGTLFDPAQRQAATAAVANASDVIVIAHGWNNDMADARQLFANFFGQAKALLDSEDFADLRQRRFVALQVFWPSKKFTDQELIPGGGAASLASEKELAQVEAVLDALAVEPVRLGGAEVNPLRKQKIEEAKRVLPDVGIEPAATEAFVKALRSAFSMDGAEPDDGSADVFTVEPKKLFENLKGAVQAPPPVHRGGAAAMGNSPAAGIGDLLSGPIAAARRIGNFFTYYEMKQRAGKVGQLGVAPLVAGLRTANPGLRIHLVGHSFGGRLVTAAAAAMAPGTSGISLTLLQAALSHNALAVDFDADGHDGAFHQLLSNGQGVGPIVITYTKNDRAVGVAYPLASRIAKDTAAALGDRNDPYGGMGRNGAQHLNEERIHEAELERFTPRLDFPHDKVTNLLVDRVVADHGDVTTRAGVGAVLNVFRA
jgi:pimeloyl-ACP methyl ester carboxylesterase